MAQRITQEPPELQAMLQDCIWQQWNSSEVPPDQIVNWLSTLAYERGRNQNLLTSLSEWADRDPEAAASFAETFQDAALQSYAIAKAALAWFRINAPACEQWLDSFADPTLNKLAREEIAKLK
jgi:hypothetical protein